MRVGLIGYGLAGRTFHAPLLQASGFFLAAIASRSLDKRGAAHDDFPLATILATAEELVEEELDLVVVASTNELSQSNELAKIPVDLSPIAFLNPSMLSSRFEILPPTVSEIEAIAPETPSASPRLMM